MSDIDLQRKLRDEGSAVPIIITTGNTPIGHTPDPKVTDQRPVDPGGQTCLRFTRVGWQSLGSVANGPTLTPTRIHRGTSRPGSDIRHEAR
jgi:hypothetical protein